MEINNNNSLKSYEFMEMLEPRKSSSLPMKCRLPSAPRLECHSGILAKSPAAPQTCKDKHSSTTTTEHADVHRLVRKIRNVFSLLKTSTKENSSAISSVIETDFDHNGHHNGRLESQEPAANSYGTFDDPEEYRACMSLTRQLKRSLSTSASDSLRCDLVIPLNLLSRVTQDVVRMAYYEPCGVRGCVIYIHLDCGNSVPINLGKVICDESIVTTFELHLTFKEDRRGWIALRKFIFYVQSCFNEDKNDIKNTPRVLSDGFQLVKKKLYRSN